jgi:hypothetical protein
MVTLRCISTPRYGQVWRKVKESAVDPKVVKVLPIGQSILIVEIKEEMAEVVLAESNEETYIIDFDVLNLYWKRVA